MCINAAWRQTQRPHCAAISSEDTARSGVCVVCAVCGVFCVCVCVLLTTAPLHHLVGAARHDHVDPNDHRGQALRAQSARLSRSSASLQKYQNLQKQAKPLMCPSLLHNLPWPRSPLLPQPPPLPITLVFAPWCAPQPRGIHGD